MLPHLFQSAEQRAKSKGLIFNLQFVICNFQFAISLPLRLFALTHPADSSLHVHPYSKRACKSSSSSRPYGREVPAQSEYRIHLPANASQSYAEMRGTFHSS